MEFESDVMSKLHCNLTLTSGGVIRLVQLGQVMTYLGVLEGVPHAETNERHIRAHHRNAEKLLPATPVHMLPPAIQVGRVDYLKYSPGTRMEFLPAITCTGDFESSAIDESKHFSSLPVVWFQDDYGLPTEPAILEQLCAIDWDKLSEDREF